MHKNNKSKNEYKTKEIKKPLSFPQKESTTIGLSLLNRISKNKRLSKKFESHSNVITSNPLNTGFLAHDGSIMKRNDNENQSETSEELVRSSVLSTNNFQPKDLPQPINRSSVKSWKYPDTKEVSMKISTIFDEPREIDYLTLLKEKLAIKLKKSCESAKRQQHGLSPCNSNYKIPHVKPHYCCCQKVQKNIHRASKVPQNDLNQNFQFDQRLTKQQSSCYNFEHNLQPNPIRMSHNFYQQNNNSNKNESFFNRSGLSSWDVPKNTNKNKKSNKYSNFDGKENEERNRIFIPQENISSPNIFSFNLTSKSLYENDPIGSPLMANLFAPSTQNEPIFNSEINVFNHSTGKATEVNEPQRNVSTCYNDDVLHYDRIVPNFNTEFMSLKNNSPLFGSNKFF